MLQFTPITDERLDRDPALYWRLVPFNLDYPCRRLELETAQAADTDLPTIEPKKGEHHAQTHSDCFTDQRTFDDDRMPAQPHLASR